MTECGKRGNPKAGFPLFPHSLGISQTARDSHIPTAPTMKAVEKWKTKGRFSTFPPHDFTLALKAILAACGG
jgi:hypothetical protein